MGGHSRVAVVAMAVAVILAALPSRTGEPSPALRLGARSEEGLFRVTIRPAADTVPIGRFHTWRMRVTGADGRAVESAAITVGGGMEGHGHGLPTRPKVTPSNRAGEYRVEGVKFTMAGEWTLVFSIRHQGREDSVTFRVEVDY